MKEGAGARSTPPVAQPIGAVGADRHQS